MAELAQRSAICVAKACCNKVPVLRGLCLKIIAHTFGYPERVLHDLISKPFGDEDDQMRLIKACLIEQLVGWRAPIARVAEICRNLL